MSPLVLEFSEYLAKTSYNTPSNHNQELTMARKSVKELRANEILDAFEICIARQGINNVTLADIGLQAGIKRPAIRHFVGNRDELRQALAQRYVDRAITHVNALEQSWPPLQLKSKAAIGSLMVDAIMTDENRFIALCNLFVIAKSNPKVNQNLKAWISVYTECLVNFLNSRFKSTKPKLNEIAHGIVMTCIGLAAASNIDQAHYSKLCSGSIAQQLSGLNEK